VEKVDSQTVRADSAFVMHEEMSLGPATLRVRELRPTLDFYVGRLGLRQRALENGPNGLKMVELGSAASPETPLLVLKEDPRAGRPPGDFAGLYHYAVLVPDRKSLASAFLAVGNAGVSYEGFADHQVSESLYLHDVEANGIEIYADRPRREWLDWRKLSREVAATGDMALMAPMSNPLDVESLLGELRGPVQEGKEAFPGGARIGHMHLRVTDLERSVRFYHEKLGLEIMMHVPQMGAAFLSAGGYHHHLGLNTWHSLGGTPHHDGDAGLDEFKIFVPEASVLDEVARRVPGSVSSGRSLSVKDPDGNRISIAS
jgi:catechol 2,3-dioxygenase